MDTRVQEAIHRNNAGVIFLEEMEASKTVSFFHDAVTLLKSAPEVATCQDTNNAIAQLDLTVSQPIPGTHDGTFFVFDRAIFISDDFDCYNASSHLPLVSAVVLFNLALSCSVMANRSGCSQLQQRTLSLYKLCTTLLSHDTSLASVRIRIMADNNSAAMHYLNGGHSKAFDCATRVSSLLHCNEHCFGRRISNEVLTNVMILLKKPQIANAA